SSSPCSLRAFRRFASIGGRTSWTACLGRAVLCSSACLGRGPLQLLVGGDRQSRPDVLRSDGGLRRNLRPGGVPELSGNFDRVDPSRFPPQRFVAGAVELAVMEAAERNGEFVAYLASEGELLGEAHVVWLRGLPPANEAGSGSDVLEVLPI